jgi:hypothetical protein
MGNSKKQFLTGTVHRLHEGVLESHYAGEEAPEWVTNPKVLTDNDPSGASATDTPDPAGSTPPAGDKGKSADETVDDLTDLNGKALAEIAGELGLKKTGSKAALTAAIRAKRAESAPAPDAEDAERTALIESLKAKGIEVDENLTAAELQALAESQE